MSTAVTKRKKKRSPSPTRKKIRTDAATTDTTVSAVRPAAGGDDRAPRPLVGTPTVPPPLARPRPRNPFAGKVKTLRGNFGTGYHDIAHFHPTKEKPNHGVWQGKLPQVQKWVGMALDSIYLDDRFVVASKPGTNGGHVYLVSMDGTTVGYLSGALAPAGEKPPATHVEVYLDRKGVTVSAFPSSPDIF